MNSALQILYIIIVKVIIEPEMGTGNRPSLKNKKGEKLMIFHVWKDPVKDKVNINKTLERWL